MPLPAIPQDKDKQIELLETCVADLIDLVMYVAGWDSPASVMDRLDDDCYKIADRAYKRKLSDAPDA